MSEVRSMENERFIVKVQDKGAELCSIYDKENNRELIWNADPAWWNRHAPVLFPFVGACHKGQYLYKGNTYKMNQHGFARDMEFTFVGMEENTIVHRMVADDVTKEKYPFDFALEIRHTLMEQGVAVGWKVINNGKEEMLFTIGAHPAFMVPGKEGESQADYRLVFDGQESLSFIRINGTEGTAVYNEKQVLELENGEYTIGNDLFEDGVLIFEDMQVEKVGFKHPDGSAYITIHCEGFPYTGIWTKPGAPFVCLEPWYGRCDNDDFEGELEEKTGVQKLDAGDIFATSYLIEIH